MRAFYCDPQGIDSAELDDASIMVVELALGRANAVPLNSYTSKEKRDTSIRDLCWKINRDEYSFTEARAIVDDEGWCIYDDVDSLHTQGV